MIDYCRESLSLDKLLNMFIELIILDWNRQIDVTHFLQGILQFDLLIYMWYLQ
jgi:hypothetical protein